MVDSCYVGRFAPSPTGPLHFGSLLAALASYLDARSAQGTWLLRIDDIDPPRELAGASDSIQRTLEHYGLFWDGSTHYQSRHRERYQELKQQLLDTQQAYPCNCSRKQLAPYQGYYPGLCRDGLKGSGDCAIRVLCNSTIEFEDRIQGHQHFALAKEVGDFIIWRRDGLVAYQLAAAADDAWQGITHVVRGIDLLDSTPRQRHLQQLFNFPLASYAHIPVLINDQGKKLSKQNLARPLPTGDPRPVLIEALRLLGQQPPETMVDASLSELLAWATKLWSLDRIPRTVEIPTASIKAGFDV
ncbi:tRNA glutamyl-Q(34) synthetase GluQRS [Aestuariirhabdus sp. Z084]|uniref:tRNA glutamyl-Q(34) synthetase GluQRS n=1 Tax=Aestuariirhabdus haliotis TaxID=2918751 RepID=UPI00201B42A0|nr:tRNA glutamyl-Q(34) synthetase GluQRS [Aestuariirhabdus haliotis]MCL6417340.1 tRNA glutamyl-Q(34) synthetase GluQRS [Aestuariirhabdus haliotis]MCL6421285.1 tRNA glutamyl-Q(34) synthetase GluQRS [Aestuariirhabdus haliotis]